MLDIKKIRQEPDFYKEKLATRGVKPEEIDEVIALDKKHKAPYSSKGELKNFEEIL